MIQGNPIDMLIMALDVLVMSMRQITDVLEESTCFCDAETLEFVTYGRLLEEIKRALKERRCLN